MNGHFIHKGGHPCQVDRLVLAVDRTVPIAHKSICSDLRKPNECTCSIGIMATQLRWCALSTEREDRGFAWIKATHTLALATCTHTSALLLCIPQRLCMDQGNTHFGAHALATCTHTSALLLCAFHSNNDCLDTRFVWV